MALEYLLHYLREMNPVMDEKREILGCISDSPYDSSNDQYRATLASEVDKRCYDDELKILMRAA